jgi:hypothetical protein
MSWYESGELELDESIVCVKRVEMSWYESNLSSNRGDTYRGTKFEFFSNFLDL